MDIISSIRSTTLNMGTLTIIPLMQLRTLKQIAYLHCSGCHGYNIINTIYNTQHGHAHHYTTDAASLIIIPLMQLRALKQIAYLHCSGCHGYNIINTIYNTQHGHAHHYTTDAVSYPQTDSIFTLQRLSWI